MGSWIPAPLAISPCWTPRWVGSWMMNNLIKIMDTQNKKRTRAQLDSDSENGNATLYPRFLVIESTDPNRPLSKLSPFVIEKCISSIATSPKSCQKLKSGALLVEMTNKVHVESLLKLQQFFSIPAQCKPHASLNTSRGIIRCPDLAGISTEDIIEGLADQNVTNARRIIVTRDGVKRETNTIILTFQTAIIPKVLKVGYLKVPVDLYIPNPLQCYSCFKFGHHESRCSSSADSKLCRRCGEALSNHPSPCANDCQKKCKCVSCGGDHMATSRTCPVWQREKEIVSVKYREGLSFQDARKVVNSRFILTNSYAMAAKGKHVKDAQTQTDVAVQTESSTITPKLNSNKLSSKPVQSSISSSKSPVSGNVNQKPEKPTRNKSPSKSEKVLSDRLPKGSDDPIQQHNRFHCLDEDMEAESSPAESINKQSRIIKINNKK